MRTITLVSSFCSRRFMPSIIMMPPTVLERSFPPVPIAWDIPKPLLCIRVETSCNPVPAAATNPIFPWLTIFPKPKTILLIIAVPQSGPMTKRPFSRANCLSSNSSSRDTLLLKIKTLSPFLRAFDASLLAYTPGTEIITRFASLIYLSAESSVSGTILFSSFETRVVRSLSTSESA